MSPVYIRIHTPACRKNNSLLLVRAPQAANPAAPSREGCGTAQTRLQLQSLSQHICMTPRQHREQNPARNGHILTQDPNKNLSHSQPGFRLGPRAPSKEAKYRPAASAMRLLKGRSHSSSPNPAVSSLPARNIPRSHPDRFSEPLGEAAAA